MIPILKAILAMFIIAMTICSCDIKNTVEPANPTVTVLENNNNNTGEFPVKYCLLGNTYQYYDSVGINTTYKTFVDSIVLWKSTSNGNIFCKIRKNNIWYTKNDLVSEFKLF